MPVSDNAATFLGINNENEFYSAHYLAEVFKGDINEVLTAWKDREESEEGYQTPFHRLKLLSRDYFAMRERSQRERNHKIATDLQRDFFKQLCSVLDIPWQPHNRRVTSDKTKGDIELPVLSVLPNYEGAKLWVLGALDVDKEGTDPLLLELKKDQFIGEGPHADSLKNTSWYDLINNIVFKQDEPPRWVLLLSDRQCILIDRYKWLQNRLLRFDWDEILGRKDDITLKASAALLHQQSLVPEQGNSLLDNLDENSHKHAFGVSEDLKYALREAIELLGNEAAEQLIQIPGINFTGKSALNANELSRECLRYMYRMLFLFYIEARPELNYVPYESEAWRKGYSLESLRDLELVKLTTDESQKGFYLHESINGIFKLIHEGYQGETEADLADQGSAHKHYNTFSLENLDSHLFDPKRTPYLNKVKFSNKILQQIIRMMSLTRETTGRGRKRRGRVSYAQLGINQLGAVYEALLSYRGFFATSDLYEVKKAKENYNELEIGYFVTSDEIEDYTEDEKVYVIDENRHKALKKHPKGKFIYRLAGRDRQKSASYYTPEVLTKCLVKYTLKERLKGLSADEILNLTVCEPAMGSAAFLNEAVNQLAEAYLTLKQQELSERITHEEYSEALQQVKMHIADHNVFGVDLNSIAVELAEVSLWLNALSQSNIVPWFGYQIFNGNSLIGARRQVYKAEQLLTNKKDDKWYNNEPRRLDPLKPERKDEEVYHFLLPDEGMAGVSDKEAKKLKPEVFDHIKKWKAQFTKSLSKDELALLQQISAGVDKLWKQHTEQLRADRNRTEDSFSIWGQNIEAGKLYHTSTEQKDQIRTTGIFNDNAKIASDYRRLKLVMDYWCALWFWPLDKAELLPRRDEWLFELNLLLQGEVYSFNSEQGGLDFSNENINEQDAFSKPIKDMFGDEEPQLNLTENEQKAQQVKTASGELNLEKLFKQFPRLNLVNQLADKFKFFHWELTFSDVFSDNGGFDIILGNPPWLKVEWNEGGVLGDYNPQFVLRKFSAVQLGRERETAFIRNSQLEYEWFSELEEAEGTKKFLKSVQNYPELKGIQTNLYKCFFPLSWRLGREPAVTAFIVENSFVNDSSGSVFRTLVYSRLKKHFMFEKAMSLFNVKGNNKTNFSINVFGHPGDRIEFDAVIGIKNPSEINLAYIGDESVISELLKIDISTLNKFKKISSDIGAANGVQLPSFKSMKAIDVSFKLADRFNNLRSIKENIESFEGWHETNATESGCLEKVTGFRNNVIDLIVSGPQISGGHYLAKTPKSVCTHNSHYEQLDLDDLDSTYYPRTNFKCGINEKDYIRALPKTKWANSNGDVSIAKRYTCAHRRQLDQTAVRTFQIGVLPPKSMALNTCILTVFKTDLLLIQFATLGLSLIYDFIVKLSGRGDYYGNDLLGLPLIDAKEAYSRALGVICVNNTYSSLWASLWKDEYKNDTWLVDNNMYKPNLNYNYFKKLGSNWNKVNCAIVTEFERRQALLEIDVIVSINAGLTLQELISIYQKTFVRLKTYEEKTYYDVNGRIIYGPTGVNSLKLTANSNDDICVIEYPEGRVESTNVGWNDIAPKSNGKSTIPDGTKIHYKVIDNTLPGGPREKTITYVAPFYLPNREEDYRVAWELFTERFNSENTTDSSVNDND